MCLMAFAKLRFVDLQRLDTLHGNGSAIHGSMWKLKTRRGGEALRTSPVRGISDRIGRRSPLAAPRVDYAARCGEQPPFALPAIRGNGLGIIDAPMTSAAAQRRVDLLLQLPKLWA